MIAVQYCPPVIRTRPDWKQLVEEVWGQSLEELAMQLGLERDRYDKHKWRGAGCCISINDNKFYDFYAGKGGVGAINFVKYVRDVSFQEALSWLTDDTSLWKRPVIQPIPEKPKRCNARDEAKWETARAYLTEQRGLPGKLIDSLHEQGCISIDSRQNVMFFRDRINPNFERGEATGASLRGTIADAVTGRFFKGLTTGTNREEGYFWFQQGEGKIQRIVVTEAPIDALSFAALKEFQEATVFLSTDGQGAVPIPVFQAILEQGGEVVLAHDCDRQGELMAWQVAEQFSQFVLERQAPSIGKDWNDQLLGKQQERNARMAIAQDIWNWYRAVSAEERPAIIQVGLAFNAARQPLDLTPQELAAMQVAVQQVESVTANINALPEETVADVTKACIPAIDLTNPSLQDVREWYRKARDLGRSERHLKCIEQVEKAFVAGQPLAERDRQMMLRDTMLWEEQALTVAMQVRYILLSAGEPLGTGKTFSSEPYLLYGEDCFLYALAQGRGTPLTTEDQKILPQVLVEAGWRIVLKVQHGEVSSETRITSADVHRFKQLIGQIQQRKN